MAPSASHGDGIAASSAAIAERHRARIYRYILRLVRDPDRAEDLTQETFLRVHRQLVHLRDPAALEAWLYRIATNLCYDRLRARDERRPSLPLLPGSDSEPTSRVADSALRPDQLLERGDMSDCVLRFLVELPDPQREVLLLHDLQGFADREIADQLGISLANVKIRLHRARTRLRAALAAGCDFASNERGVLTCEPRRP